MVIGFYGFGGRVFKKNYFIKTLVYRGGIRKGRKEDGEGKKEGREEDFRREILEKGGIQGIELCTSTTRPCRTRHPVIQCKKNLPGELFCVHPVT